ncbi:MAG: ABC transporter substrate-binding protein [wastewater metagenome]|nr:ABC transporter substrate-binding protein [Candidatus Loosdrechtia aerotolerans]
MTNCGKVQLAVFVCIFALISLPTLLRAGEPEKPGKLIMDTIDKSLAILQDPSLQGEQNVNERRSQLWQEISPIFNFEEMSKRALGQHWKDRSPKEKKEFVELFTCILRDTYIGKTDVYTGEKVIYLAEKRVKGYATVQTKFVAKGNEISVHYRLLNNGGEWRVYDVIIEGVSLIGNYRSQFNSVLMRSSYKDLVQKLKEKTIVSQK